MSNHHSHIPNWEVIKLGDVTEIVKGGTPSRNIEKYFRGSIAWAIPSDISSFNTTLYINDTETHITEEAINNSAAILLPVGTVLLSSRATIGDTAINTVPMATNQGFANFICYDNLSNVFLAYYLRFIKKQLNDLASGSTFKEITKGTLLNIEIPDIPIQEQLAITEVLSDVDRLINALDALIAKKRAIKQATMQQLLTGKTRIPGFSGDWETKLLGEITECLDNVRVPLNETQRATMPGPYPYCGANGVLDYVNDYVLDDDVILIAEDGGYFDEFLTRPIAYQMSGKIWVNNHAHILKAKSDYDQGFLYYSLVHKNIMPYLSGGTRAKLNKFEMYKIEINVPNDIAEQSAIAAVLSDMDTEIAALVQRRDKTIAIKQGMMQQLLTGKVRLSESRIIADNTDDAD